jgi:hypothetical protein
MIMRVIMMRMIDFLKCILFKIKAQEKMGNFYQDQRFLIGMIIKKMVIRIKDLLQLRNLKS